MIINQARTRAIQFLNLKLVCILVELDYFEEVDYYIVVVGCTNYHVTGFPPIEMHPEVNEPLHSEGTLGGIALS